MDWHDRLFETRLRVLAWTRQFDARPLRERMAVLLGACALLLLMGDRVWLTPAFRHFQTASQALGDARREQQALEDESRRRREQGEAQRRALEAELAQWRQRNGQAGRALAELEAGLIGPERMVELLEQMLPRRAGVRVVGLKTLPPQPAAAPAAGAASAPAGGAALYRHGVELTVEGHYGGLMDYLSSLESLPGPKLLWGGIALKVERHPTVQLTLTVYTLSLDRAWLQL